MLSLLNDDKISSSMIYFSDLLTILRQFLESIFTNLVPSHIGFATKNECTKSRPFNKHDISIGSTCTETGISS